MTRLNKKSLLATASAAAICMMAAAPASAFDRVNWTWDATVVENVTKDITIAAALVPTGMAMIEDLQVFIGDVTADSMVTGIENNQPAGGDVAQGPFDLQFTYGLGGGQIDATPGVTNGLNDETDGPIGSLVNGTVTLTFDPGEIGVAPALDSLTELPAVISAATAVANNTSITSDVMVELHEGQFAFDVVEPSNSGSSSNSQVGFEGGALTENSNLTAAGVLGVLALNGDLAPAQIEATSTVSDILNASVDSAATAVANNLSVSIEPKTPGDSVLIADIVQFAYANVSATSSVSNVSLNNYTNLGNLGRPIVNSVATAVGNNKSITVMTPVVSVP
jgi:hypothetical protein